MARKSILFIPIVLLFMLFISNVNCSKLNVPRVLLPIFNEFSSNFTLEATEGGCYKWTTSRLDLVQLIPLDSNDNQDCSSKVVVSTISKERTRNTAIVLAEDIYTGQILRCDVIVDVIASLNIVTTTRELFMEEAPEAFEVRAYDDQGNEFTTLHGVEFEWTLGNKENVVLRFITFRDSPYETPPSIEVFEELSKQGHIVLLEGVKTGSAKISVRLPHTEYRKLDVIEVPLMVIANLIIEPSDIYILRGDVVHYKIIQVKHGRLEEIQLPSEQYYLMSNDPEVGLIERNSGYLTGLNIGRTNVYLHDNNVREETGMKLPSATVHVQYPGRITLSLLPHRNWAVQLGDTHSIIVECYTSDDHKIHLGEGVHFNTLVDQTYFKSSFTSLNGSFITGTAIEVGTAEVRSTLISVESTRLGTINLEPKLTARAEMFIFPKITLNPAEVILPWDPITRPRYDIELKASGGDGRFLWSTTNHSIGVVTNTGFVRTQWHGQFDVCASMIRNHHNRFCAKFFVIPPSRLDIIEYIMEAEIGEPIFLHVALYGDRPRAHGSVTQIPFTKCDELPFQIKSSDSNFFQNKSATTDLVGISCTNIAMSSSVPGNTRITIKYDQDDINLEQSVSIATYRPLQLLHPESQITVLALGTSRFLVFTGGPRPWSGRPSEHIVNISSSEPNIVEPVDHTQNYKSPGSSDIYVVYVHCKEIGESVITLTVYNLPTMSKCKYHTSVAKAIVVCAHPYSMTFHPEIKVADKASCPMDLNAEQVIVQSYQNVDLIVNVKDSKGRLFDNITTLDFKWQLNPTKLGSVENKNGVFERTVVEENNIILPNTSYQTIVPSSQKGTIDVYATVNGYRADLLKTKSKDFKLSISAVISLILVDDTVVLPNKTSIYNHPLNKQHLQVLQGSGYNELQLSAQDVANVVYSETQRHIEVTPVQNGQLVISVRDLCLTCPPTDIILNIVSVAFIRIEVSDRVEISKCIPCVVKFYDEFDNLMPLPKLEYLDVRYTMSDKILQLKLVEKTDQEQWPTGELHYIISGLELGETKLTFAAGRGNKEIVSAPVDIQVFSPLRIYPRNATLLIGSVLQLTTQGGPQPDTNVEFSIETKNIAEINSNGIVHGLALGHTKLTGRSVSINPANGKKVINSQDSIDVHVIPLIGIKLSSPLTRFIEGTTVPIWVTGLPETLSSLLLGSMNPPLIFNWTTHCSDIITLHGIFSSIGILDNSLNKISVRAKGTRPGPCTIELNVQVSNVNSKKSIILHRTTLDMEVIEGLYLTYPKEFNGRTILMAPYSKMKLKTNKDGYNSLKYSIQNSEQTSDSGNINQSVSVSRSLITIDNQGVITSRGNLGQTVVTITVLDEHGLKQTLNVIVQVKPIHYMMLTAQTNWLISPDSSVNVLPVGSQFQLVASYHDNTGTTFSAAQCDLFARNSRLDLLDIKRNSDNITFSLSTLQPGYTVLKLWSTDCFKTADYVHIYAEQVIKPKITKSLTNGDVICLSSPVINNMNERGKWSAEPEKFVHINANTGISILSSGASNQASKVFIQYDLTPSAKVVFNVEPISDISFVFDRSTIVSNTPNVPFKVPLLFRDANNPTKISNLYKGWDCNNFVNSEIHSFHFTCDVSFENESKTPNIYSVFGVQPMFVKELGLYSCNFIPLMMYSENTSIIESKVILTVTSNNGVSSEPLPLIFYPAIFIPSTELIITDTMSANLVITGLPQVLGQVHVAAYDSSLVQVNGPIVASETVINYEVNLIDYHWKLEELKDSMSVIVTSKLTNQNIKIQLRLQSEKTFTGSVCSVRQTGGSPLASILIEYKQVIYILIISSLLLFFTIYAYSHYIQPVINVNVASGMNPNKNTFIPNIYHCYNYPKNNPGNARVLLLPNSFQSQYLAQTSPNRLNTSMGINSLRPSPRLQSTLGNRTMNSPAFWQMRNDKPIEEETAIFQRNITNTPGVRKNRSFL